MLLRDSVKFRLAQWELQTERMIVPLMKPQCGPRCWVVARHFHHDPPRAANETDSSKRHSGRDSTIPAGCLNEL